MATTTATARGMKDQSRNARISAVGVGSVASARPTPRHDGDAVDEL